MYEFGSFASEHALSGLFSLVEYLGTTGNETICSSGLLRMLINNWNLCDWHLFLCYLVEKLACFQVFFY